MSNKKRDNPKTVTMMAAATIGGVGLAAWSISNALAPPSGTSASTPPVQPASATTLSPQPAGASTGSPESADSALASQVEANLAPEADPFVPLPEIVRTAANPDSVLPVRNEVAPVVPLPGLPGSRGGALAAVPYGPAPGTASAASSVPAVRPVSEAVPEPELVGTLLGDRPCAVFRAEKQLAVVPVGGKFGEWKVVSVQHGSVTVRSAHRTLRLGVSVGQPQRSAHHAETPAASALPAHRYIPAPDFTAFATASVSENAPQEPEPEATQPDTPIPGLKLENPLPGGK